MNRDRLLQRFLRYVQIDTTARPEAEGYPSSPGQLELGRLCSASFRPWALPTPDRTSTASCWPRSRPAKGTAPLAKQGRRRGLPPRPLPCAPISTPRRRPAGPASVRR